MVITKERKKKGRRQNEVHRSWEAGQIFTLFGAFLIRTCGVFATTWRWLDRQLPNVYTQELIGDPLLAKLKALLKSLVTGVNYHLIVLPSYLEALHYFCYYLEGSCFCSLPSSLLPRPNSLPRRVLRLLPWQPLPLPCQGLSRCR